MTRPRPELLRWDNWTPPTRTPWGGRAIPDRLKAGLSQDDSVGSSGQPRTAAQVVGESWELSLDPAFPSRLARTGQPLAEVLAEAPLAWLGRHAESGSTPMLVKILDAAQNLSVQVHPADDAPWLAPGESGKPEAWVVLARAPGAGVWLGLNEGVTREDLAAALHTGEDLRWALNFVPVEVGDAFIIEAGTVHAVGEGVTLLEPQLVRPGRSGVTYRFWDWGRRYDSAGRLDANGQPRALHIERSLLATRWDGPRGAAFVAQSRAKARLVDDVGGIAREHVLDLHELSLERWSGLGRREVDGGDTLLALVVTRGTLALDGIEARMGQTVVAPARGRWSLRLDGECFAACLI